MARSIWKGPFLDALLLNLPKKNFYHIWSRRSTILSRHIGKLMFIHNGRIFIKKRITEGMVGHKIGEFAMTRKIRIGK